MKRWAVVSLLCFAFLGLLFYGCGGGGGSSSSNTTSVAAKVEASVVKGAIVCVKNTDNCEKTDDNGTAILKVSELPVNLVVKIGDITLGDVSASDAHVFIRPLNLTGGDTQTAQKLGAFIHAIVGDTNDTQTLIDLSNVKIASKVEQPLVEALEKGKNLKITVRDSDNNTHTITLDNGTVKYDNEPVNYDLKEIYKEIAQKYINFLKRYNGRTIVFNDQKDKGNTCVLHVNPDNPLQFKFTDCTNPKDNDNSWETIEKKLKPDEDGIKIIDENGNKSYILEVEDERVLYKYKDNGKWITGWMKVVETPVSAAEKALSDFWKNPTDDNYNNFISAVDALSGDGPEENLFRGVAGLAKVYEDNKDVFQKYLGVSSIDDIQNMTGKELLHNILYANNANYNDDIGTVLDDIAQKLGDAYEDFDNAEAGLNGNISIAGTENLVYFDKYDFECLKVMAKSAQAVCYLAEAVNLGNNINWNVSKDGRSGDLRQLIEKGEDIPKEAVQEFVNNNSDLLTWSNTQKLNDFRQVVSDLNDLVAQLKNDFSSMDDSDIIAREHNAFFIGPNGIANLEGMASSLNSLVNAFSDSSASLVGISSRWKACQAVEFGDKWYKADVLDFYKVTYSPSQGQITVYDLANSEKSLRDLLLDLDSGGSFYDNKTQKPEPWKQNVYDIEDELQTYTIPVENISIDGDASDWDNVPVFWSNDSGVSIKLARDNNNNLYMYIEEPEAISYIDLSGHFDDGNWHRASCNINYYNGNYHASYYDDASQQSQEADLNKVVDSNGNVIGIEIEFPDIVNALTQSQMINTLNLGYGNSGYYYQEMKLLPVSD